MKHSFFFFGIGLKRYKKKSLSVFTYKSHLESVKHSCFGNYLPRSLDDKGEKRKRKNTEKSEKQRLFRLRIPQSDNARGKSPCSVRNGIPTSSIIEGAILSVLEIKTVPQFKPHSHSRTLLSLLDLAFGPKEKGINLRGGGKTPAPITALATLHATTCSVSLLDCQLLEGREHTLLLVSLLCLTWCLVFTRYLLKVF